MRPLAVLAALPLLLLALPVRADDPPAADLTAARRGADAFGLDLWRAAAGSGKNAVLSPFSVATALGMTAGGAAGETEQEMRRVLRFELPAARQHAALGGLARSVASAEKVELNVANRLFAQTGKRFEPAFLAATRAAYGADVGELAFETDAAGSRKAINGWVAERTRDRIKELLGPTDVTSDTRLVLVNAIYFKGQWETKFPPAAPGPFTLASGEAAQAPLMRRAGELRAAKLDGLVACDVPYRGGRLVLTLLVPDRPDGLAGVEARLAGEAGLASWLGQLQSQEVRLVLPKLKVTSRADLAEPLKGMGMPGAFAARADFSAMTGAKELMISKVVHQAFLLVDEEGSEAAAATAVVMVPGSAAPRTSPLEVRADRPFLMLIRDLRTGLVLFLARVVDPR